MIFCGCVGPAIGIASVWLGRRRIRRPHEAAWQPAAGARVVTPVPLPPLPATGFSWTGGCNVPSDMGRVNASYPLAALLAAHGWARIEMRPRFAQRLFGYHPITYQPSTDTTVFPARTRLGGGGIGFQTGQQPPAYFWTGRINQPTILTALAGCGFDVRWEVSRAKLR